MTQITDDPIMNNDASSDSTKRDYEVQSYQDELTTDPNKTDPIMSEENDDPVQTLGVPANELRDELDKRVLGDPHTTDDMREEIEDLDEDPDGEDRQ